MKLHKFNARRPSSFTLVELLVVLGIISILASVLLIAGTNAMRAALRAKAGNMENQIQVACMSYYNDYGVLPVPPTNAAGNQPQIPYTDTNDWQGLIYCLNGNTLSTTPSGSYTSNSNDCPPNTRAIAYLQLNNSAIDTNGVPVNAAATVSGSYFNIALDGAYSGFITNVPVFGTGTMTAASSSTTVAASVYLWANCNPASGASNVNWWVHSP